MPSDRARVTFDPTRKWRGLIAQQGRVSVEADWNEAAAIAEEYDRQLTLDFVGPIGTPLPPQLAASTGNGYSVAQLDGASGDLEIQAGVIYVGGERLELEAPGGAGGIVWSTQPEWLDNSTDLLWTSTSTENASELVYLLAYELEVSAVEDPALADAALGGPDTMQRRRIVQHFVREGLQAAPTSTDASLAWIEALSLLEAGAAQGAFGGAPTIDQSTMLVASPATLQVSFAGSAAGGYLGSENQLIRVMVAGALSQPPGQNQSTPPTVVWGFDDASFLYRVQGIAYDSASGRATLTLATLPVDSYHRPIPGQVVELLRDAVALTPNDYIASPTGVLANVVSYESGQLTVAIDASLLAPFQVPAPPAAPPAVATIVPAAGVVDGATRVTVTGSGFTGATEVSFGDNPGVGLIVLSDTQLTVFSPPGTDKSAVDVSVSTANGTSPTGGPQFTYAAAAAPTNVSCTPTSGGLPGGTLVVVNGSGLTAATEVTFGDQPGLALTVLTDAELTVMTPAAASAAPAKVTVFTSQGPLAAGTFTYTTTAPPQLIAIQPAESGPDGGTTVTLTGSGFTGATEVAFGDTSAGSFAVVSDNQINAVVPAATAVGSVPVTVTVAGTSSPASALFTYAILVTGIDPSVGSVAGGTEMTISGIGFENATAVDFGGVPAAAFAVVSDTRIVAVSPPGADSDNGPSGGIVDVVVTVPAGTSSTTASDEFSYAPTPQPYVRIWQSAPAGAVLGKGRFGFTLGSTGVTATLTTNDPGGRFRPGEFWRFALRPIAPTAVDPPRYLSGPQPPDGPRTWICPLAYVDWGAPGSPPTITQLVPGFSSLVQLTTKVAGIVQTPVPTVTAVSPAVGSPYAPTLVTVTGTGFANASAVMFGTEPGTEITVVSNTQLNVFSPPQQTAPVTVTVMTPGGISSAGPQFGYVGISEVSPSVGPVSSATAVTITGTGFTNAESVLFGTTAGTDLVVVSDGEITVTSPSGISGAVDLIVTGPLGNSPTWWTDRFIYAEVDEIAPTSGPQTGGTLVTVSGSGFTAVGLEAVTFGGVTGGGTTVVSDSSITVSTPSAQISSSVPVSVVTSVGTLPSSAGSAPPTFFYTPGKPQKEFVKEKEKDFVKDVKEKDSKEIEKAPISEKITRIEKQVVLEKVVPRANFSVFRPAPANRLAPQAQAQPDQAGTPVEPKPPETTLAGRDAVQERDPTTSAGGQAFISQDERPAVGSETADQDEQ